MAQDDDLEVLVTAGAGEQRHDRDQEAVEHAVVDTFRLRHLVGEDLALEASASWWRSRPRDVPRLTQLGQTLGGWPAMYDALQVLQA